MLCAQGTKCAGMLVNTYIVLGYCVVVAGFAMMLDTMAKNAKKEDLLVLQGLVPDATPQQAMEPAGKVSCPIQDLTGRVSNLEATLQHRFSSLEGRFAGMEERFAGIEGLLKELVSEKQ